MDNDSSEVTNNSFNTTKSKGLPAGSFESPTPVVKVLSVRGVEYFMMSLALWFGAASLIGTLVSVTSGQASLSILSFPLAALLVTVPVFAFFFTRLRKQEIANPELRYEPSKRRLTQLTQIFAFLACLLNVIYFVQTLLSKIGGAEGSSLGRSFINLLIVLAVAGGILAYYWFDEHKLARN